ncbi:MAG: hypothetical protein AAF328_00485 [Planctomycetota bacterium]
MAELITRFVFESPWPFAVLLAVAAAAIYVISQQNVNPKLRAVPPAITIVAFAVLVAGYAVETANEKVDRQTRALVAATAPLDRGVIQTALAEDVRLLGPTGAVWMSGEALKDRLASIADRRTLDQRVISLGVSTPTTGPINHRVAVLELRTRDQSGVPILSSWALHWRPTGDSWELFDVRWLSFAGQSPDRSLIP